MQRSRDMAKRTCVINGKIDGQPARMLLYIDNPTKSRVGKQKPEVSCLKEKSQPFAQFPEQSQFSQLDCSN